MLRFFMSRFLLLIISFFSLTACEASTSQNIDQENTMSLLGKNETYIVSPPFEGHLYDGDKPLLNVKIIRKVSYNTIKPNWDEDEFYTDGNGYFNIPKKEVSMKLTFLDQFLAVVEFYIEYAGDEKLIWSSNRMINEELAEFGGVYPGGLKCNTAIENKIIKEGHSIISTKCVWAESPLENIPLLFQLKENKYKD